MSTPPPPPLHHFQSPPSSPYTIHTPDSEGSFDRFVSVAGSDRYSDAASFRQSIRPKIETREPPFSGQAISDRPLFSPSKTSPAMTSTTTGRDYLYFVYERYGSRWDEDPNIHEIPAPQDQIRKKADTRSKNGTVLQQLQKMGPNRRAQIERHVQVLNASETDGSLWEPVYIDNTKIKQRITVMEVKSFEIIFARTQPKPRRNSMASFLARSSEPGIEIIKEDSKAAKVKKEKRKSRDKKAEDPALMRGALADDPFGATQWFDVAGLASGGQSNNGSGVAGLPTFIPPEKPIGDLKPRIVAGLDPDKDDMYGMVDMPGSFEQGPRGLGIPFTADGIRRNASTPMTDDDIVAVVDDDDDGVIPFNRQGRSSRRFSNLPRSRSGRRGSQRPRSNSRARNVRFSSHFELGAKLPASDNSSMASDDIAVLCDEVEELSSRTSEETSASLLGKKIYRPATTAYRQHRPGPNPAPNSRKYELGSSDSLLMPARSRRRSSHAAEDYAAHTPYGLEQPLMRTNTTPVQTAPHYRQPLIRTTSEQPQTNHAYHLREPLMRRNTSVRHKTTVHQQDVPRTLPTDIPPIAVYPHEVEAREQQQQYDGETRTHDYIRDTVRRRILKEQEDRVAQRERVLQDREREILREQEEKRQRETLALRDRLESLRLRDELGQRRSVYNYEPRDHYERQR